MDITPISKREERFMLRHYIVTGNKLEHLRRAPTRFAVVCGDIEKAIYLAKKKHPGLIVLSVADQGMIDQVDTGE